MIFGTIFIILGTVAVEVVVAVVCIRFYESANAVDAIFLNFQNVASSIVPCRRFPRLGTIRKNNGTNSART